MKRFLALLFIGLMINSCDDGDLVYEEFNFDDGTIASCSKNSIIYKLKDKEALILELPTLVFPSESKVQTIDITGTNRLVYRFFNGVVAADNICETIPPATPQVTDQWIANGGKVQITSVPQKSIDETNNSTKITGYNHSIIFLNVPFKKSDGTIQSYPEIVFGDYKTTVSSLPFAFTQALNQCSSSKQIYNYINSEALTLNNIDTNLIKNEATPLNSPRTGLIGTTTNTLVYQSFSGILTNNYFCNTTTPILPSVLQEWKAAAGVANTSGIIEVTTTSFGTGYKHIIVLKKVKMTRGSDDFLLGDTYSYGELITN